MSILTVVIAITTTGWLVYSLPKRQTRSLPKDAPFDLFQAENEARRTIITVFAGLLAVGVSTGVGSFFTWRQTQEAAQRRVEEKEETIRKRLQEIYDHGISNLGSSDSVLQLSGIYSLEQVARESKDSLSYPQIITRVFASYVRSKAPRRTPVERDSELTSLSPFISFMLNPNAYKDNKRKTALLKEMSNASEQHRQIRFRPCEMITPLSDRSADVQAILEVLSRNSAWNPTILKPDRNDIALPNLRRVDLRGLELPPDTSLPAADFADSDLSCSHSMAQTYRKHM